MTEQSILVVEDSEALKKVLAEMLRNEKYIAYEAGGGEEGMRLALEKKPDLIITDVVMFPMDGLEMTKQIRQSGDWGKGVHIIALTNQNSAEEEGRLTELNLTAYLIKADTSLEEVVNQVKAVLKKKK
ncbi:MAG: Two-component system response regulator [Parcubacteria group bacterium GW2011_GWA2_47_7]|nr:MAG: Two-component system response regulator [Parcubacteria group bacterium GW2011_GWA2_47_7]